MWVNHFDTLAIGYSLERVAGVGWESTNLATFCASLVPRSNRIAKKIGDLSSGKQLTWVSEFGSEIYILLCRITAKTFALAAL